MFKINSKIPKAFDFAFKVHGDATRKAKNIPYIVHPLEVALILMKANASEDLIIAGLLHDVIEDAGIGLSKIKDQFGEEVYMLVGGASEPAELRKLNPKTSWQKRKQYTIDFISRANKDQKLLACADKLSNIQDILEDYNNVGDKLWKRFNAPKEKQKWYYKSLSCAFVSGTNTIADEQIYLRFKTCVNKLLAI
ncbi:MAG: HD domain-containing protein [Promethearchaeota archaeon]